MPQAEAPTPASREGASAAHAAQSPPGEDRQPLAAPQSCASPHESGRLPRGGYHSRAGDSRKRGSAVLVLDECGTDEASLVFHVAVEKPQASTLDPL
jgi:hypothetical protein